MNGMQGNRKFANLLTAFLCVLVGANVPTARAQNSDANNWVWIEAQDHASINVEKNDKRKIGVGGWGRTHFLSGGSWFQISVDEGNTEAQVPAEGILLSYKANIAKAGSYEVWNRLGMEFVRSPFEWRIDGGAWQEVAPEMPTTDLMALETWNEVAWLKLGDQQLEAGAHTLDIRLPKRKDDKGKFQKILYTSDAILLHPGHFVPNGPNKPNENFNQFAAAEREQARQMAQAAGQKVFELPTVKAAPGTRVSMKLEGDWEVARHDETLPTEVAVPIAELPTAPRWTSIPVPADKNASRPDLLFAHRLWYRTRVDVPQQYIGRSFGLTFPLNNLNTTIYVNGRLCGFNKNPFAKFDIDVTKAIKGGQNEIWVGIRDAWYGFSANPDKPMKLRRMWNYPHDWWNKGFMDLAYPIWNNPQSGLLETPTFWVAGSTYAADVFVKPSVANKQLNAEITLLNSSMQSTSGEVQWAAIDDKTGEVEKTFAAKPFTLRPGAQSTLDMSEAWPNPKLWWPDTPHLYRLRTSIVVDGETVDARETPFGFRQWSTRGIDFLLNGVRWQMWADLTPLASKTTDEFLKKYRETHQRTFRLMMPGQGGGQWRYLGMSLQDALSFFDREGVVVRRNGPLDGEVIGYKFSEDDPDLKTKYGTEVKMELVQNWRDQMVAQVKGERNHPSINIWTIENEFAYINLINLLGNSPNMDAYEREIQKTSDAVMAVDPTRTVMIDGGGATKFNTLPIHGDHYVYSSNHAGYPDRAYEANTKGGGRGRWEWDMKRPRFIGEDFFGTGINPADYAMWGGEQTFQGKTASYPATALVYRMLMEGYRWGGYYGGWHFWAGAEPGPSQFKSNPWRAAFVRQWDWTFGSGQKVKRTWGLFNDTQYSDALTFTRTLQIGGKSVWKQSSTHQVAPGSSFKFDETLSMPTVATRQEGQLVLTLAANGKEVFRDSKAISVLPDPFAVKPAQSTLKPTKAKAGTAARKAKMAIITRAHAQMIPNLNARSLLVFDPQSKVAPFLKNRGVAFSALNSLENLSSAAKVLLIGPDALSVAESTSSRLAAYASTGKIVLVLDQQNPLKYHGVPAEVESASANATGSTAFIEDTNHPAFIGLQQKDFFTWGPDGGVYRGIYMKPSRGGKSLVQAGPRLSNSALLEVPVGSGLMLLSQLEIGRKIGQNVVAQQLLANLLRYSAAYKQEFRPTAASFGGDAQLPKALDAIGLQYTKIDDPIAAISNPKIKLAIIEATLANLKVLLSHAAKLNAFTTRGGYIVFHGLTPEGLNAYNTIVGFDHMIRPFRRERVVLSTPRHPLTAGLTLGDVVMYSGERIFGWVSDEYVASDIFSYVVDYEDVAPFGKSDSYLYENAVNNFFQADGWKLINNFDPKTARPEIDVTLPKAQTIRELVWVGNTLYNPQTKVGLSFDDKAKVSFTTLPNAEPQNLEVKPPRSGRKITLQILESENQPDKRGLTGIDNFYLNAARPKDFYQKVKPMLNIGALMHYPRGAGGYVLCNLLFKDTESVPVNVSKKRTILSTILRNLQAPFGGSKTVIAGANLKYTPIDFSKQATQYRNDKGWFGDAKFTFVGLQAGKQKLGGVVYDIYDFPTSPVPNAIMLGGSNVPNNPPQEVKSVPVNQKADALFFLHTARLDSRRNANELRDNKKFEMLRYVVNFADGKTETVPIYAEIDIDDWKQTTPRAIPGAQIAWTKPYEGTPFSAVAYSKQWNNPRPDVGIKSIDMQYGPDKRGVPVLLALTAAKAVK